MKLGLELGLGRDNRRIFWATLFDEGAIGIYITLWPLYIASLGASPAQIGLVIGLAGVAQFLFLLPSGLLAERMPPRQLIVIAHGLSVLGFILVGLSREWWQLLPGVLVLSAGVVAWPAVSTVISDEAGQGRARIRAFTIIYSIGPSVALLVTPALGGLIAERIDLRAVFFIAALCRVVSSLLFWSIRPRPAPASAGAPASYREALRERPIRRLCLLGLATIFVLTLGITLTPNFLREVHAVDIGRIGLLGSMAAVGSIILGLLISRVPALGRPLTAVAVAVGAVAGMLVILLLAESYWLFALAYLLRGGYFVAWSLFYAALSEVAPERLRTRVYALVELLGTAGFSLAPFAAGPLYGVAPTLPMVVALALLAPLLVTITWLARAATQETPPVAGIVDEAR